MKKLLFITSAVALLLTGCAKEEFSPSSPDAIGPQSEVVFTMANDADVDTKAYIEADATLENFYTRFNAETDKMAIYYQNVKAGAGLFTPLWNGQTGAGRGSAVAEMAITNAPVQYKATTTGSRGYWTSVDDNNLLSFGKDGSKKAAFRAVWPASNIVDPATTAVKYSSVAANPATEGWVETMKVPVKSNVNQDTDFTNILMVAAPIEGAYSSVNSVGETIGADVNNSGAHTKLSFSRPLTTGVIRINGYNNLFGNLKTVSVTTTDNNISFGDNTTIDIAKKVNGAWVIAPISAGKTVTLKVNAAWEDGDMAFISMLPIARNNKDEKYTITYTFDNIIISKEYTSNKNWPANEFCRLPILDLNAEPYFVLGDNTKGYSLLINSIYDGDISKIFYSGKADATHTIGDVINNSNVTVPKDEFITILSKIEREFTAEEVAKLKTLGADAKISGTPNKYALENASFANTTMTTIPVRKPANIISLGIPNVSNLGTMKFADYTNMTKIDISGVNTEIPASAFEFAAANNNLKDVIGVSFTEVGAKAFKNCDALVVADFKDDKQISGISLTQVTKIGANAFEASASNNKMTILGYGGTELVTDAFKNRQFTKLIAMNLTKLKKDFAPKQTGMTTVILSAYSYSDADVRTNILNQTQLQEVDLSAVENVGLRYGAGIATFKDFTALKTVWVKEGVNINDEAFNGCSALVNIYCRAKDILKGTEGMKYANAIGQSAFQGCTKLVKAYVDQEMTAVSVNAFNGCTALTEVNLGDKVVRISDNAFEGAKNLAKINTKNITTIAKNAFKECSALLTIDFSSVTILQESAFEGCSKFEGTFSKFYNTKVVNVPMITVLAKNVFKGCSSVGYFKFANATVVNNGAFENTSPKQIMFLQEILLAKGAAAGDVFKNLTYSSIDLFVSENQGNTPQTQGGIAVDYAGKKLGGVGPFKSLTNPIQDDYDND